MSAFDPKQTLTLWRAVRLDPACEAFKNNTSVGRDADFGLAWVLRPMTSGDNRLRLNDRIGLAVALAKRHSKKSAVVFLDLDGFKHVNDSLGHPTGDKLLQSVATRLVGCMRGCDTVSRQGGDEFVALLGEVEGPEDAAVITRRMLQAIEDPHSIDGCDLHIVDRRRARAPTVRE